MNKELEILKLKQMLEEAKIPFEFTDDLFRGFNKPSYKITINDKENLYLCDAIYHYGSYGYEKGLLEIMGALTDDERENDSVKGYLSANEVFKRFKYCYENNTDTYKDKKVEASQRLESIDNSSPSGALECLEDIYRNGVFISGYDALGKQHTTNISPETNKSISEQCNTIKQALIKAQENEKDKVFLKNIHNTRVRVPLVDIFNGLPQEKRFAYTEHIYYHWEEMKEALEAEIEDIKTEKENLESKVKRQEKVLEIIKEYQVDIWLLKQCDYENYIRIRKEAMVSIGQIVNEDGNVLEDELTKEEFELLKAYFEKNIQK